ncbi:hypothetical protein [Alistipes communis]|uniref:pyocin knob domain-containing protein n=1 Tax=Alistipes communis TaxID=2585118 RepID=UPI003AB57698
MARKISPLTEVPFYPVRKDPQERFDTLIKAAVDGGATLTRELNATFIPVVNAIAGDVESAQSSVAADKEETKAKAGEAAASAKAADGSAAAAKASQNAAKTSETNAKTSETNAAKARQDAAASADTATKKAGEAGTSATAAAKSAEAALASKNAAKTSETNAKTSETAAKASETKAKTSETAAAGSETKAKTSETNAKASETAAANSATAAKKSETNAGTAEKQALTYRNEAEQFKNEASVIANVSMATTAKAGLVKPDGTTTQTDATGKLTVRDVAIDGDTLTTLGSAGMLAKVKYYSALSDGTPSDADIDNEIFLLSLWSSNFIPDLSKYDAFFYVRQFFYGARASTTSRKQIAYGYRTGRMFTRTYDSKLLAWSSWVATITDSQIGDGLTVNNGIISVPQYEGATASTMAKSGLVPPALSGDQDKVLSGAGTWVTQGAGLFQPVAGAVQTITAYHTMKAVSTPLVLTIDSPSYLFVDDASGNITIEDSFSFLPEVGLPGTDTGEGVSKMITLAFSAALGVEGGVATITWPSRIRWVGTTTAAPIWGSSASVLIVNLWYIAGGILGELEELIGAVVYNSEA